jgi:hypothetical protein
MKKIAFFFLFFISICSLTNCSSRVKHADPFYNVEQPFSIPRIPLIEPTEVEYLESFYHWRIFIDYDISVRVPTRPGNVFYIYDGVNELEKFAVENGVIMAYSAYVDTEADAYIQDNFYHWFVLIPDQEIAEGFQTEAEFREYIQSLGIQDPDWRTPDEARKQFLRTGCLEWFPDCD